MLLMRQGFQTCHWGLWQLAEQKPPGALFLAPGAGHERHRRVFCAAVARAVGEAGIASAEGPRLAWVAQLVEVLAAAVKVGFAGRVSGAEGVAGKRAIVAAAPVFQPSGAETWHEFLRRKEKAARRSGLSLNFTLYIQNIR